MWQAKALLWRCSIAPTVRDDTPERELLRSRKQPNHNSIDVGSHAYNHTMKHTQQCGKDRKLQLGCSALLW